MKITHIIIGLDNDGAEAILFHLIKRTLGEINHSVISMRDAGFYGRKLTDLGIDVTTLNMAKNLSALSSVLKLSRILRKQNPDMIQTWMYHANLLGGAIATASGFKKIAWGIHHCSLENDKLMTRAIAKLCALLSSSIPSAVVFCSKEAASVHERMGYDKNKTITIQNGYDLFRFKPNNNARQSLRRIWNIGENEMLLGMVGRWHPCKDHANLLAALSLLKGGGLKFRCVLIGPEMLPDNAELTGLCRQNGVEKHIILAGPRSDIPDVMNAMDIHILASYSEAFPNVIAEAMASGTPCVATDVGDTVEIIGNDAWVVPPRDPKALAAAIVGALDNIKETGREALGHACRQRISQNFSLERMVVSYRSLWKNLFENSPL